MPQSLNSVTLLGVRVEDIQPSEIMVAMKDAMTSGRKEVYGYANIHGINIAFEQPWFRDFLNRCEIVFCDGFGVKLAAKLTGHKLEHRNTPPDFFQQICELAVENSARLFFLGARPGIAEKTAAILREEYPDIQIMTHHGHFNFLTESEFIVSQINNFQTKILVLGMGMPQQERWIIENYDKLNVSIILPAGAIFDYVSGTVYRAPRWMTDHGFEWLGRLAIEPRRLWKRYIIGNPLFFWRIIKCDIFKWPLP
jgi:N-acetylglucosaminyldiphosphoundecaprenol N-acetyl-beta-D-mannosaminyltransferase